MTFHIDAFVKEILALKDQVRDAEQEHAQAMQERLATINRQSGIIADLKRQTKDLDHARTLVEQRLAIAEEVCKAVESTEVGTIPVPKQIASKLLDWQHLVRRQFRTNFTIGKRLQDALTAGLNELELERAYHVSEFESPEAAIKVIAAKKRLGLTGIEALEAGIKGGHGVEVTPATGPGEYEMDDEQKYNIKRTVRLDNEVDGR